MTKIYKTLLIGAAVAATMLASTARAEDELKIGVIAVLSGPGSHGGWPCPARPKWRWKMPMRRGLS